MYQQQQQAQQEDRPTPAPEEAVRLEPLTIESPTPPQPDQVYPTGSKFWFTVLSLCVILILGGLDANIVATAVPSITNHFHTVAHVGWYSSAFRLCTCAFQFGFAKLYTLFSIKVVFLVSNVIFLVGSVLCATAASSPMFVVGRAVSGLGFAGELAGCFAVLIHILPLEKRPVFAGLLAINLPIGAVSLLTMSFLFSDPRSRSADDLTLAQKIKALDLVSNCLFIPSLTALFIALSWAGTKYPWSDGKVIGLFVVFAVLLGAFLFNQYRRGDSAALPFRVIRGRSVIAGFIFTTCTNSMTNVLEWYLPTYYQVVRSKSPSESGYLMMPILVGMMLGLFIQGFGTTMLGYYAPFMLFASICMPIAAGLMTTYSPDTSLAQIILYSGFAGFSGGIGFQGSQAAVQTTLRPEDVNLGIGVILFGQSMGPAIFIAIAQVIFTNHLSSSLEDVVPGLSPAYIEEHGLGDIKQAVPVEHWDDVLLGIDRSLTRTWYLPVALACTTMQQHLYYPPGVIIPGWRPDDAPRLRHAPTFVAVIAAIAALAYRQACMSRSAPRLLDRFAAAWFSICCFLHICFEGYYIYNRTSIAGLQTPLAHLWKEYTLSDSRYLTSDVFTVCVETITVHMLPSEPKVLTPYASDQFVWGPLCLLTTITIISGSPLRHVNQVIVCTAHLYGVALYYATNWTEQRFTGVSYSRPEFLYYWIYYVGFNMPWAVVPVGRAFGALQERESRRKNS
ncbi:DNA ligase (Polydeoxyribonucleotide synthase) [Purpureocillium lavendulum]|uniref:DNA ligase (Polydeoxyribonucleotide synthase) n=1 Tax=Purpureocillium lavendulum TaxID=1247861 RepID=A0AB34FZ95_9HYPO|nr:DNA ligase (Polydeoxyribonucleotide synthase) [Purpureocillium lavendulum]